MLELFTTIDEVWLPYACMMLESIRRTTDQPISCRVLHENIRGTLIDRVCRWADTRALDVRFVHLDSLGLALPARPGWTRSALWGRYLISRVVPPSVARCIYLDVDVIATRPLDDLMSIDLSGRTFGAVVCPMPTVARDLGIPESEYFNNGVLVIDVARFPGETYVDRMDAIMKSRDLVFGPQSAVNLAARGDAAILEPKWNVQGEHRSAWTHAAHLIHFTGDIKPWHYLSTDPLRSHVKELLRATPFTEAWEPDRTLAKAMRRFERTLRSLLRGRRSRLPS